MDRYFVNRTPQANGDHEVHKQGCYWLARAQSTQDLGLHTSCRTAVAEARRWYRQSNGCATCAAACHTS
ncbi:hypothetical protein D7Y46_18645 [Stenotrophomonas maltophilia]|nr:hypothetical protein [Stenotrophomonas maltophilia]OMP39985.1 hypothetical protein BMR86_09670 [Stenotrophomonas sp. KAs 5-3]MBA0296095.1 hypothetical protein [Stenotrophomonas maltophilia]MBA0317361.1 hypothetical protein [Stenotrophomonas maltophilia]MBA0350245.1 hypothetical protein [Stenotrophomonas maltophilia]